jgi:hypothetical protein
MLSREQSRLQQEAAEAAERIEHLESEAHKHAKMIQGAKSCTWFLGMLVSFGGIFGDV